MLFMCTYQVDRDKQADTQAFFANMTDEQITGEYPAGVKQVKQVARCAEWKWLDCGRNR